MTWIRGHLRACILVALASQGATLSALVLIDCCAPHQPGALAAADAEPACPLHEQAPPVRKCSLRSPCDAPLDALISVISAPAIPSAVAAIAPDTTSALAVRHPRPVLLARNRIPDIPPPRL